MRAGLRAPESVLCHNHISNFASYAKLEFEIAAKVEDFAEAIVLLFFYFPRCLLEADRRAPSNPPRLLHQAPATDYGLSNVNFISFETQAVIQNLL